MTELEELRTEVSAFINNYGSVMSIKYFASSGATTGYDDAKTLTQSGNTIWASGLKQPINSKSGSSDHQLVQQGKVLFDDSKIYFNGSLFTNGSLAMKVGLGSPSTVFYTVLPAGIDDGPSVNGGAVYKKVYVRALPGGSLAGE